MFGSTVHLASRICAATEAGHVLVSELVRDLGIKEGYSLDPAGERVLKGYSEPTPVFELMRARHAEGAQTSATEDRSS